MEAASTPWPGERKQKIISGIFPGYMGGGQGVLAGVAEAKRLFPGFFPEKSGGGQGVLAGFE